MKKHIVSTIGIIGLIFIMNSSVSAKEIGESNKTASDSHTAREEAEGKTIWEKIQAKQTTCADLSDDNFAALGEYFMGQMMGNSHEAMNNMMTQMMGEKGEEQMHVTMGKRLSGCNTSSAIPSGGIGFLPMMNMMMGGWQPSSGFTLFGGFSWIFVIFWWALIIFGIVVFLKWLTHQFQGKNEDKKSALEILRKRYARGEIDKTEFEEKKQDIAS